MNKRKPDDEFAQINLSYFAADGTEVMVFCPESKAAVATQQPLRQHLARRRMPSWRLAAGRLCRPVIARATQRPHPRSGSERRSSG